MELLDKIRDLRTVASEQRTRLELNRKLRYIEIDTEALRRENKLSEDEIFVPQHIIDSNIRREQAAYIAYLSQSTRAAIFKPVGRDFVTERLEKDFTNRVRYSGWQFPIYRVIDGMQQNGFGICEIVPDITKPGNLVFQDVDFGCFGFPKDTMDIQSCETLIRIFYFTKSQLRKLVSLGFNQEYIDKIIESFRETRDKSYIEVEKVFFRKDGVVHVGWSAVEHCDEWLKEPSPLYIGRYNNKNIPEVDYPFVIFPYLLTENTTLQKLRGRVYLDQDTQEAVTSLMSSFVTAHRRGSYLLFARNTDLGPTSEEIGLQHTALKSGDVISAPVVQFQLKPPDPTMLSAIQALMTMNVQEISQINYAAQNRKDSRKTATEIQASMMSAQMLSAAQLNLFSAALTELYTVAFEIIRSRIFGGLIKVDDELKSLYAYGNYVIIPAGDVDFVERQQKISLMTQMLPVIGSTGAKDVFIRDLIKNMFPNEAESYLKLLSQGGDKFKALSAALLQILASAIQEGAIKDPKAVEVVKQATEILKQDENTKNK
jgi:hypothetical protein